MLGKKIFYILSSLSLYGHPKLASDQGFVCWFDCYLWLTTSILKVPWVLVLFHLSSIFDTFWPRGFAVLPVESLGTSVCKCFCGEGDDHAFPPPSCGLVRSSSLLLLLLKIHKQHLGWNWQVVLTNNILNNIFNILYYIINYILY